MIKGRISETLSTIRLAITQTYKECCPKAYIYMTTLVSHFSDYTNRQPSNACVNDYNSKSTSCLKEYLMALLKAAA